LLYARLQNTSGGYAGKTEVVHIYQNLTTKVAVADNTFLNDDFSEYLVTNTYDSGPGSLRQAITDINTLTGVTPTIRVMLEPESIIKLHSRLPDITKNVIIEGNGVTLAYEYPLSDFSYGRMLIITNSSATVTIRKIHFKLGSFYNQDGGAIGSSGSLTLESCIFSGNKNNDPAPGNWLLQGGAIYGANSLTIRGCTFYECFALQRSSGAVHFNAAGRSFTLTGNLFYGNTTNDFPVVQVEAGSITASYNVVDVGIGTAANQCGWSGGTGNTTFNNLGITGVPVDTTTFVPVSALQNVMPVTAPTGFPTTDFYGATRNTRVPGAVNYAP
jgi:hypothetical protein